MTTTAFDDQFTDAPEPARQPYDTGSILRRNVADLEIALKQQAERAEAAEAELASLRWQEPVATLLLSYDGADFEMYYDNNKLRFEGMSMKLYAAAGAAPAALEMLRAILNTADAKRIFDALSGGKGIGTDDGRTWLAARALLQSRAVKDSLTSQADCRACANRGRINGLSQESYCDSCVYEWRGWRQNHFVDASKMAVAVNRRCEACAILPCSCK